MQKNNQPASQEKFKTLIGGQALIEGILMQGPDKRAIVVRGPEGLVQKVEPIKKKHGILTWPLIRGVVNFGSSMVNGVKALMYSADFFPEAEGEPSKFETWLEKKLGSEKLQKVVVYLSVVLGVALSVGLFILLPTLLASFIPGLKERAVLRSLIEGVFRILIFLGYMIMISKTPDMKRVFSYHGAEHKTIRCYEARLPLTVENVRPMTRFHPRCGTSFLLVVMVLWTAVLKSGVHATLAGVIVGFFVPLKPQEGKSPAKQLEHVLHPWVAFMILPLFAFANAGVSLEGVTLEGLTSMLPLGIIAGLFIGKPLGISLFCWLALKLKLASLPHGTTFKQIMAVGVLCGIGFTMSIFISTLAFGAHAPELIVWAKLGILIGSLLAAVTGYTFLKVKLSGPVVQA